MLFRIMVTKYCGFEASLLSRVQWSFHGNCDFVKKTNYNAGQLYPAVCMFFFTGLPFFVLWFMFSTSVCYTEHKPRTKNEGGLGTRLLCVWVVHLPFLCILSSFALVNRKTALMVVNTLTFWLQVPCTSQSVWDLYSKYPTHEVSVQWPTFKRYTS